MHPIVKKWLPRIIGRQINVLSVLAPTRAGKKAFDLFSTPRKGRLQSKDQEFLESAESSRRIPSPHGNIQTYSWNKQGEQSILLIHGWESNAARWRFLIPQLIEQNFQVIAMDAPAHGQSDGKLFNLPKYAESIHFVMQDYQADNLVGHSIGGMAVAYYLSHYEHPAISKMIIMGAPAEFEKMLFKFRDFLSLSDRSNQVIYQHLEKKFGRHPSYFSIKEFCTDLSVPALIIHDEKDKVVPFEASKAYMDHLENAQLLQTRKFGHSLQNEKVFTSMLNFLQEGMPVKK